jgi:hypothetical protein
MLFETWILLSVVRTKDNKWLQKQQNSSDNDFNQRHSTAENASADDKMTIECIHEYVSFEYVSFELDSIDFFIRVWTVTVI